VKYEYNRANISEFTELDPHNQLSRDGTILIKKNGLERQGNGTEKKREGSSYAGPETKYTATKAIKLVDYAQWKLGCRVIEKSEKESQIFSGQQ